MSKLNCKGWKTYKGIQKPRCKAGKGCPKCWEIYWAEQNKKEKS